MKSKTLIMALVLAALVVAVPTTYVLAHPSRSYYGITTSTPETEDEWWNEMQNYMEQRWNSTVDEQWWQEMREHMEQRWGNIEGESWWNEMSEHMEQRWADLEDGAYRYSNYGGYSRFGGCHG